MSSWGTQRRNSILLVIFILIAVPSVFWFFVFSYEAPTCFDGKKNGPELDVDCGGSCSLLCSTQTISPYVKWERFFQVAPGVYNAMAYVENQNSSAGTKLRYRFSLYDKENAILAQKEGSVNLRPKQIIPIAANVMNTGKVEPTRVSFEIIDKLIWNVEDYKTPVIVVSDESVVDEEKKTTVNAKLSNIGFGRVSDVSVVVILYDQDENAIGVSSTYVEKIDANNSNQIIFTWPRSFDSKIVRFEIIPLYESN